MSNSTRPPLAMRQRIALITAAAVAIVAIAVVVIAASLTGMSGSAAIGAMTKPSASPSGTPSATATPASDTNKVELSPELKALLDAANAPLDEYVCSTVVTNTGGTVYDATYSLFLNTLLGVKEGDLTLRQWSDALSTVLRGSTPEEMRDWIERAICEEPLIGASLAHLFAHLEVQGVRVLSLQSTDWLEVGNIDASEINDLAASFMPVTVWKLENFGKSDVPDGIYTKAVKANHEYQELASRLIFLLSRYELSTQVTSINSTHHYHLVAGGLTADGFPEVEIETDVDTRPALVFYLTEKTACKPISVLGFNVGDKRPMLGVIPETCEPFVPPMAPPPTTPPSTGGCETNCEPPPPPPSCVVDCVKDWGKNVIPPAGVTPAGPDPLTPRPSAPATPAPVIPGNTTPGSGSQAPGATVPDPVRSTPPPATGGDGGSVNPTPAPGATTPPVNEGDPGNHWD